MQVADFPYLCILFHIGVSYSKFGCSNRQFLILKNYFTNYLVMSMLFENYWLPLRQN